MHGLCGVFAIIAAIMPASAQALSSNKTPSSVAETPTNLSVGAIENVRSLKITVEGTVRQHCAIGNVRDMDFGDLRRPGLGVRTRVAFDCNVPFTMSIKGANGALTHSTMPNGQGTYGGAVPYSIAVAMPVRHPAQSTLNRSFNSSEIRSGGVISSNGGIATDGMTLDVQLGAPSGDSGLLAGDYAETITITVNPL